MMKLNCSFPWIKNTQIQYETCSSNHKVNNLVKLIDEVNLGTPDLMKEIEDFGCNEQNCVKTNWRIASWQKIHLQNRTGITYFKLTFPSAKKVSVTEESLAYTKLDLLADIGGYAGIFIGASMITIYDMILAFLMKIWMFSDIRQSIDRNEIGENPSFRN